MSWIINPTREQMRTLQGLVYAIRNKTDGKHYIGQTVNTFYRRYRWRMNWWDGIQSLYLKAAITKHGPNVFEVVILEHGIEDKDTLNRLEVEYSERFRSHYPTGYNLKACGDGMGRASPEMIKRYSKHQAKEWHFKDLETGEEFHIRGLREFGKNRGINGNCIGRALALGRGHRYKQYVSLDTTKDDVANWWAWKMRSELKWGPYVVWKEGRRYEFGDIKVFIRQMNIRKTTTFLDLLCRRIEAYAGYALDNREIMWPAIRYRNIRLLAPDDKIVVFNDIASCVTGTGLGDWAVRRLIYGEGKGTQSGYRLLGYDQQTMKRLEMGPKQTELRPAHSLP